MKKSQFSSTSPLTAREAKILARVSGSSAILYSDIPQPGHIQTDVDLVQDLLDRKLLTAPPPIGFFDYRRSVSITHAGTAALAAHREACAARRRDTILKVVSNAVSLVSIAIKFIKFFL